MYYHLDKVQFLSFDIGLLTGGDVDSLTARIVQTLGEAAEHVTLKLNIQRVQETFAELIVLLRVWNQMARVRGFLVLL